MLLRDGDGRIVGSVKKSGSKTTLRDDKGSIKGHMDQYGVVRDDKGAIKGEGSISLGWLL